MTRAVAGLLMITSDDGLSVREMRRDWELRILEKGAGENKGEDNDFHMNQYDIVIN